MYTRKGLQDSLHEHIIMKMKTNRNQDLLEELKKKQNPTNSQNLDREKESIRDS
jgi:hypothetical protein